MTYQRKRRFAKYIISLGVFAMLSQMVFPTAAFALTEGPSQPEQKSFTPINATDMVDLFSGNFKYNLPLMEVPGPNGGYPINLGYNAGITTDQEASMVGLGWNLNLGNISRSMRGLPDDFKEDLVKESNYIKPDRTVGINVGPAPSELFGFPASIASGPSSLFSFNLGLSFGASHNTYRGYGANTSLQPSLNFSAGGLSANAGVGFSFNSQTGVGLNPSASLSYSKQLTDNWLGSIGGSGSLSGGVSISSREGLASANLGVSANLSQSMTGTDDKGKSHSATSSLGISASHIFYISMPFSSPIEKSMRNNSVGVTVKLGTMGPVFGQFTPFGLGSVLSSGSLKGFIQTNRIAEEEVSSKAYGYLYSEGTSPGSGLMDFARYNDLLFNENSKNLPVPMFNNDFYQIKGHGVGGSFRPYRSKHGVLFDPIVTSESGGADIGVEFGWGMGLQFGLDLYIPWGSNTTGPWTANRDLFSANHLFNGISANNNPLFEPAYFKMQGEMNADVIQDNFQFNSENAERVTIEQAGLNWDLSRIYRAANELNNSPNFFNERGERKKRNTSIQALTKEEAEVAGTSRYLYEEGVGTHPFIAYQQNHHLAEFVITNPTGTRYIYGYPAYNTLHKEVAFSYPAPLTGTSGTYGPEFLTGNDYKDYAKKRNAVGDEYYKSTEIDPYAHDYLLNAVVGPDYLDVDGVSGPSEGDMGYWTRIDYTTPVQDYKWRAPYWQATYMTGVRNNTEGELNDDKGTYLYGQKDLVYPDKVHTKTHFAEFTYTDREDGLEAAGELALDGQQGSQAMKQLDKITLFAKTDVSKALITVHFDYDFTLCPNTRNSGATGTEGKLTLKKVWFTYFDSQKGALSPYEFTYNSQVNYEYDETAYDNWGYYKEPFDGTTKVPIGSTSPHHFNSNLDFPWVDQTTPKSEMDNFMSAWNLSSIKLPSGAQINIDYEADDYAFVQDKQAMEMVQVVGIGTSGNSDIGHDGGLESNEDKVYVRLHDSNLSAQEFHDQYLNGIEKLFFRMYIQLNGSDGNKNYPTGYNDGINVFDYVTGYCEINNSGSDWFGIDPSNSDVGWFRVQTMVLSEEATTIPVHPFSKAAWQYTRLQRPNMAFNPVTNINNPPAAIFQLLVSMFQEFPNLFTNYNQVAMNRNGGQTLDLNKSHVRLNSPNRLNGSVFERSKFGGGHRVKQVTIDDQWLNNGQTEQIQYGQEYEYTTTTVAGEVISSGVAENEPGIGAGENPLKSFKDGYTIPRTFHVDNNLFTETPLMAPFYPGPNVGYSKVTVRSIGNASSEKTKTGSTMHEFYTAKDFPVRENSTSIDLHPVQNSFSLAFFGSFSRYEMSASQGYSIVLNDMHGKAKSTTTYSQAAVSDGDFIAKTLYKYKTDTYLLRNRLNNEVQVLTDDGIVENAIIGRDFEQYTSMRETRSESGNAGGQANLLYFFPALFFPTGFPYVDRNVTTFRTAVNVKIIQEYGILEETESIHLGSHVVSKNLMYDAETGVPLLSSVTNEFDDPIYTYNYPTHWYYPGMEPAYRNIGYVKTGASISGNSFFISSDESSIFIPGDELLTLDPSGDILTIESVAETSPGSGTWQVSCYGDVSVSGSKDLKIIRSGHRNQQAAMTGKTVFLEASGIGGAATTSVAAYFLQLLVDNAPAGTDISLVDQCAYNNDPTYQPVFDELTNILGCTPSAFCLKATPSVVLIRVLYYANYQGNCGSTSPVYADEACKIILVDPITGTLVTTSSINTILNDWSASNTQSTLPNALFEVFDGNATLVAVESSDSCQFSTIDVPFTFDKILHAEASTYSEDWTLDFDDANFHNGALAKQNSSTYNPYIYGEKGIFRVLANYAYKEERDQVSLDVTSVQSPQLATEGTYDDFVPFDWLGTPDPNWIYSSSISKISPRGYELENTNALNILSAALYGYDQTLPTMRAVNSGYYELASTGFEDIIGFETINSVSNVDNHFGHFGIYDLNKISSNAAHTGQLSLEVDNSGGNSTSILETRINGTPTVSLETEGEYLVSMWVREAGETRPKTLSAEISMTYENGSACASSTETLSPSGPVIEGWQKIEDKIIFPASSCTEGSISIDLLFSGSGSTTTAYVDDVRLQPFDSEASVYVYDPVSKRYEAALDGNNFATFYDYDEEGNLTRVRRETEEGIRLLQEYNSHIKTSP